ncbi:hypothetical protein NQZ79_g6929 [Umbelopsis isabellina]|nr:hypothetical protein NQZ79_g6929 [Umbelopsis isabellina]
MALSEVSFKKLWLAAAILRIILLVYGEWQDTNFVVKYTDIDYLVFTDAARHITQGESPYRRATYRYTPLLAMLLTPNIYLFRAFGKCIFVGADLLVGWLMYRIMTLRGMPNNRALFFTSLWLFNPMVANISTRGNCESILGALVLGTIYLLLIRHFYAACACFGLAVHLKIYPIIYAAPFLVLLDEKYGLPIDWPNMLWTYERLRIQVLRLYLEDEDKVDDVLTDEDNDRLDNLVDKSSRVISRCLRQVLMFLSPTRVMFGLVSGAVFFALGGLMYSMYEDEFLQETYFYHVIRKDHRHNFSVWFYNIYLTFESNEAHILGLLTFFPQLFLVLASGFAFGKDIFFRVLYSDIPLCYL